MEPLESRTEAGKFLQVSKPILGLSSWAYFSA
jgi:hypothetical protein